MTGTANHPDRKKYICGITLKKAVIMYAGNEGLDQNFAFAHSDLGLRYPLTETLATVEHFDIQRIIEHWCTG